MNPSDADNIPAPLKRLRDAVWGEPEDDISHAECRALLPAFVQAEVDGEPVAKLYARVKHHLDHCDECGEEYALLLDLELAEMRDEIEFSPVIAPVAPRSLEQTIQELARRIVESLAPASLPDFGAIAETFFARIEQLGTFELRSNAAQALGLGKRDTNPALNFLAASYAATQTLAREITRAQFEAWIERGTLAQEIETRADAAARAINLDRDVAARFARAYAEQIAREPDALRGLLS